MLTDGFDSLRGRRRVDLLDMESRICGRMELLCWAQLWVDSWRPDRKDIWQRLWIEPSNDSSQVLFDQVDGLTGHYEIVP